MPGEICPVSGKECSLLTDALHRHAQEADAAQDANDAVEIYRGKYIQWLEDMQHVFCSAERNTCLFPELGAAALESIVLEETQDEIKKLTLTK